MWVCVWKEARAFRRPESLRRANGDLEACSATAQAQSWRLVHRGAYVWTVSVGVTCLHLHIVDENAF